MKINANSWIFYALLRKLLLGDSISRWGCKTRYQNFPLLNVLSLNIKILDKQVPSVFNVVAFKVVFAHEILPFFKVHVPNKAWGWRHVNSQAEVFRKTKLLRPNFHSDSNLPSQKGFKPKFKKSSPSSAA